MYPDQQNIDQIILLCQNHNVQELYFFGSILTDKYTVNSDVDLLVLFHQMDILDYFDNYMDFKEELESLFDRDVDLVELQAIRNPIFKKVVDREKQLIYDRESA